MGLAYQAIDPEKAKACFARASTGLSEPVLAMYYNDQQPHTIFYQGLALQALGKTDEAYSRFNKLISYGESHLFDDRKFDYFAVSLPDFLVFERDLNRQNQLHCNYMMALGYFGLGEFEKAHACFDEALKIQPNFYGAWSHKQLLEEQIGEMS